MHSALITCPYDAMHQIRPERIQYHLIKCKKNHPNADHVICPYNATHHVPKAEERDHLKTCVDRRVVEVRRYQYFDPVPGQHGNLNGPTEYGSSQIYEENEGYEGRLFPPSSGDVNAEMGRLSLREHAATLAASQQESSFYDEEVDLITSGAAAAKYKPPKRGSNLVTTAQTYLTRHDPEDTTNQDFMTESILTRNTPSMNVTRASLETDLKGQSKRDKSASPTFSSRRFVGDVSNGPISIKSAHLAEIGGKTIGGRGIKLKEKLVKLRQQAKN